MHNKKYFLMGMVLAMLPVSVFAESNVICIPVTVEGAIFGGDSADRIETEIKFDPTWMIEKDNQVFHEDLASFSALVSADVYFREKDLERGTQNRVVLTETDKEYTQTALLEELGFSDVRYVESFKEKEYPTDNNDSVVMVMGYQNMDDQYDEYIFGIRGCFSIGEWISMFDLGCDSDSYTKITGPHEEWTNSVSFKGVNIASNRAKEFIDAYMAEHDNADCPDVVLLTGHSKGAAVANMIGAELEHKGEIKAFTYTFSTPSIVESSKTEPCQTIFNVFDSHDFFTDIFPFAEESYGHYGTDICRDISVDDETKKYITSLTGRDAYSSVSAEEKDEYDHLFAERFNNRESLYKMQSVTETFETEEAAEERKAVCEKWIGKEEGLDLGIFCSVSEAEKTEEGMYQLTMQYCDAALMWGYARLLAYGGDVCDAFTELFAKDEKGCEIAEWMRDHLTEMRGGHLLINGYAILNSGETEAAA